MANTFAPFGFRPIKRVDGSSWTGNQSVRKISSTCTQYIFCGDPVYTSNTAGTAAGTSGYIGPMTAAANQFAGIFVGCEYLSIAKGYVSWSPVFPGGDTAYDVTAYVIDDPLVIFAVATNNSSTTATAVGLGAIGNTAYHGYSAYASGVWSTGGTIGTKTAGNFLNGQSGVYLDQNSFSTAAGSTYPFKIYDIPNVQTSGSGLPSGTTGLMGVGNGYDATTAYNIVYVTVNAAELRVGQSGV